MRYSGGREKAASGAVVPVVWYLLNLLVIPVIGFAVLAWLYIHRSENGELRQAHTQAAFFMSVIGALLIGAGVALPWLAFGNTGHFWTFALVWAIVLHTGFVLWGMVSLAFAMSDKPPLFPSVLL
ncbi:hypothetical protein FWJ25_02010 [Marinobacter salinexigens]|uniref:DUF4870 domain-containing protein n=1 Tax=Marinobacter salinexigens TaxID=2919747 RepID=A0A5B0VMD8_9GAMM|nr:hypothetical protein [Marinobacter salinexigens]KAA1175930.1 hypothetical protein FWJ25_02010 [Marinobacter salinexigens]